MNKIIFILFLIVSILFIKGILIYTESLIIYSLFTLTYFLLLFSAIFKPVSYSYLYLSIFLFLGMWLKFTLHLILDYPYVEPIGSFYTKNSSMDDILIVATVGGLGIIMANILYRYLKFKSTIFICKNDINDKPLIYIFYNKYKLYVYFTVLFFTFFLVYSNIVFEIQLSGMVPKTILPYPLNAIVYWVIGIGLPILLVVLFSLDIKFKKKLSIRYLFFLSFILSLTSIGLLSRGQYVFILGSFIIFLFYNFKNLNDFNVYKFVLFIIFSALLYLVVIDIVTVLRNHYFSVIPLIGFSEGVDSSRFTVGIPLTGSLSKILHLGVDRWIGMEGIMAVSSYEYKSFELFFNSLNTLPEIGKIDIYQYISNAHYKDMDNTKFAFATIPGVIAYLYYSGSFIFVFCMISILTFLVMIIEYFLYIWYKSALLTSFMGMYLANAIAQLGLMPMNFLKSMFMTFSFLLIFKLIKMKKSDI